MANSTPTDRTRILPLPPAALPHRNRLDTPLPVPLTSLVGRDAEVEQVCALLDRGDVRLVTLTGPGGAGKTRLAIEVATTIQERFPDGTAFVALAPIRDPSLVADAMARALGIPDDGDQPPEARLIALLRHRHLLLVLDNVEQVSAAAPLIARLLAACPRLRFLATGRHRLRISGERLYPVPPLDVPPDLPHQGAPAIASHAAVRLFVQRAEGYAPGFALTGDNASAIAGICRRLDGLPLAIELAAARIDALPPATLLAQLDHRLPVLTGGPLDAPDRQRTMRDAIAWSYDLLDEPLQAAFRRLAVCVGDIALDTVEALTGEGAGSIDTVAALVAHNLMSMHETAAGEPRYTMLETIREYGLEQLAACGEEAATRNRHAAFLIALAQRSEWSWFRPIAEGAPIQDRLAAETANFRAALHWLEEAGDWDSLLALAGSLGCLWGVGGDPREGEWWLQRALDHSDGSSVYAIAKARATLSWVLNKQGKIAPARLLAEESLTRFRELGDGEGKIYSLILAGVAMQWHQEFDEACAFLEEALIELAGLAGTTWRLNAACHVHALLGTLAFRRGDIPEAESRYSEAIVRAATGPRAGGSYLFGGHALAGLGTIARAQGDQPEALRTYQAALELAWAHGDMRGIAYSLGGVAGALAGCGNVVTASRLFGASEALHERMGYPFAAETLEWQRALGLPEPWLRAHEGFGAAQAVHDAPPARQPAPLPPIRKPGQAAKQWEAGRSLSTDEAILEALRAQPRTEHWHGLSNRELDVLRLLTSGKTDVEIAEALYIARRTAATHVEHIYAKLNVSSRAEAAAWAVRHDLA